MNFKDTLYKASMYIGFILMTPLVLIGAIALAPAAIMLSIVCLLFAYSSISVLTRYIYLRNRNRLMMNGDSKTLNKLKKLFSKLEYEKGVDLRNENFSYSVLGGLNFSKSNLKGSKMIKSVCKKANFKKSNLEKSSFQLANLKKANLEQANLRFAKLQYANLKGANLENANLRKANLKGANLASTAHENTTWNEAIFNEETVLPFSKERAFSEGMRFVG